MNYSFSYEADMEIPFKSIKTPTLTAHSRRYRSRMKHGARTIASLQLTREFFKYQFAPRRSHRTSIIKAKEREGRKRERTLPAPRVQSSPGWAGTRVCASNERTLTRPRASPETPQATSRRQPAGRTK